MSKDQEFITHEQARTKYWSNSTTHAIEGFKSNSKVLEIGSDLGQHTKVIRSAGHDSYIYEPDAERLSFSQRMGHAPDSSKCYSSLDTKQKFDAITIFNFSCLKDSAKILKWCADHLESEGKVVITTSYKPYVEGVGTGSAITDFSRDIFKNVKKSLIGEVYVLELSAPNKKTISAPSVGLSTNDIAISFAPQVRDDDIRVQAPVVKPNTVLPPLGGRIRPPEETAALIGKWKGPHEKVDTPKADFSACCR